MPGRPQTGHRWDSGFRIDREDDTASGRTYLHDRAAGAPDKAAASDDDLHLAGMAVALPLDDAAGEYDVLEV